MPPLTFAISAVFFAVALITGALAWPILSGASVQRKRLQAVVQAAGVGGGDIALSDSPLVEPGIQRLPMLPSFVPKSPQQLGALRRRLGRAGYYKMSAAVVYSFAQVATPVAFGVSGLLVTGLSKSGLIVAAGLAGIGYMLPSMILSRLIKRRQKAISNGLPDVLDLLIVCLEAGSGLDQAIMKASEELALAHPELAEELRFMTTETRAGKPRLEAFRNLASRTGVDDVRALVAMLVQTDRFGTSVAQALRVHAATSRTKRRQRAEERAAKVGVKLVFPLVFCLMPAFYVVTLGPALLDFIRFFGSMK